MNVNCLEVDSNWLLDLEKLVSHSIKIGKPVIGVSVKYVDLPFQIWI